MKNKLIVFEGIDGVGKSTFSKEVVRLLKLQGIPALRYEDTEDLSLGFNLIKAFIKDKVPIESSYYFYLASSIYKSYRIKQLLRHNWVVCDRYVYSTLAFHRARGLSVTANPFQEYSIMKPDKAYWLRVKENVRLTRILGRERESTIIKKKPGSISYKMEEMLGEFGLEKIDNTPQNPEELITRLVKELVEVDII